MKILAGSWLIILGIFAVTVHFFFLDLGLAQDAGNLLQGPGWPHVFGTDSLGRDIFFRLMSGAWVSLGVGILGSVIAVAIGLTYGILAGWVGGFPDRILLRGIDLFTAIPSFVLVAILSLFFQKYWPGSEEESRTIAGLILAIGFAHWLIFARVARALVMKSKILPYVEAAQALGASPTEIIRRHVIPNILPQILVLLGLQIPLNILYESFMSFIGVGVQPPQTSWGILMQEGWRSLSETPHLMLFPAAVLFLTVWSIHALMQSQGSES